MRAPAREPGSLELIETATTALGCGGDVVLAMGKPALYAVISLEEAAQPHLRHLLHGILGSDRAQAVNSKPSWSAGLKFLLALQEVYRGCSIPSAAGGLPRGSLIEVLVRRIRSASDVLKWRAYAYCPGEVSPWVELVSVHESAIAEGIASRQVSLRTARRVQTSVEREFTRAVALQCASLDRLSPDSIDIADRLIRYLAPVFSLSSRRGKGAAYTISRKSPMAPRRVISQLHESPDDLFFLPSGVGAPLDELSSVIAKGLVPAALASGPQARERVLAVVHHLRRLWSETPPTRRHRRHSMAGRVQAILGFRPLHSELAAIDSSKAGVETWSFVDASRNGMGVLVPADDCANLGIGDLVGVRAEGGQGWHIGVVRRIVRQEDGAGIVGLESIARYAVTASIDDGRSPAEVLLFDPVRRGAAIRLAHALPADLALGSVVFLSQGGRVCKLRPMSTVIRGVGYKVLNYYVL